jgi:hypothetical protein
MDHKLSRETSERDSGHVHNRGLSGQSELTRQLKENESFVQWISSRQFTEQTAVEVDTQPFWSTVFLRTENVLMRRRWSD